MTCSETAPQIAAARRLTREQYTNSVRDLLGEKGAIGDTLPMDDGDDGLFVSPATLIVTSDWAGQAMTASETVAKNATANMSSILPCPASEGESCAGKFIDSFGKRAFRRPLEGDERDGLLGVFRAGNAAGFNHGIELVIQAVLQSPSFLYRFELGQKDGSGAGTIKLTPYEIAARLSYGLWGTTPDDVLLKAADANQLATTDQIATQARRLLDDPRAKATLVDFTAHWFGLDGLGDVMKDATIYPEFNDKMMASMNGATKAFATSVLGEGDGKFATLLTADYVMVDATTAMLYGVAAPGGAGFGKVTLPTDKRTGLLSDVGVITAHTFADSSAPIHRGKFVRERLLCTEPPNPPADLMVEPPTPKDGVSTRERLKEHVATPACQACHTYMDPIGFAFGNFDGLGRWRDKDQGADIDVSGTLNATDVDGDFKGVGELAKKLMGSKQVEDCVNGTFLRFISGMESEIDTCARDKMRAAFAASGGDLRELVLAITRTDAFQYRRANAGEVMP